jgi:uncharacterized GH25 family protein
MHTHRKLISRAAVVATALATLQAGAHTLFIKPATFIVNQNEQLTIPLINGTFVTSKNRVPARRITGAKMIRPDGREVAINDDQWSYDGKVSYLSAEFPQSGNYVVGIGTQPMMVRIAPDEFNFHLRYEGLDDDAEERSELGEEEIATVERYQKFAKAILQVGTERSDNYASILGYPVEIVPLLNPYTLRKGDVFRARIVKDGKPLTNELVYATHEGNYDASEEGIFEELVSTRSDANGEIEFVLQETGRWYIRFIHLTRTGDKEYWYSGILVSLGADEPRIPYQSLWATLTFEVM